MIAGLIPVIVLVALIWLIASAVQGGHGRGEDHAQSLRRFLAAGLLLGLTVVVTVGVSFLLQELLDASTNDQYVRDNDGVARSLAFVLVGGPGLVVLSRAALARLRDPAHRASASWQFHTVFGTAVTLAGAMVSWHVVLRRLGDGHQYQWNVLGPAVAWTAAWAFEWELQRRRPAGSNVHRLLGSAIGLVTGAIGLAGSLSWLAAELIYRPATGVAPHTGSGRVWLATLTVGAVVWVWYWLAGTRNDPRTPAWYALVLLIGGLGGLVTAVTAGAIGLYRVAIRLTGELADVGSARYFRFAPGIVATTLTGLAVWGYHRIELRRQGEPRRSEPVRASTYLSAAAGLVAAVIGIVSLVMAVLEALGTPPASDVGDTSHRLIAGLTLLVVGGPTWALSWRDARRWVEVDPIDELRSVVRRVYLTGLFGAGVVAALAGVVQTLTTIVEDRLDGVAASRTLYDCGVGVGLVVSVAGVTWYHLGLLRREHASHDAPATPPVRKQIVLVAPDGGPVAEALAQRCSADVVRWDRDDAVTAPVDVDRLVESVNATAGDRLLVVIGANGPDIVRYRQS